MMDQLSSVRKVSTIVADTGEISEIKFYQPHDVTTNASLILRAVRASKYDDLVHASIIWACTKSRKKEQQVEYAIEYLTVSLGVEILKYVPGSISTAIDARFSYDIENSILQARRFVTLYNNFGVTNKRILIKLAATWQGICAASKLEQEGIRCNLTLLFSFAQARACAEAGVYLISLFVGRILDWHITNTSIKKYTAMSDPGVMFGRKIYEYYKKYGYQTIVMCASFRNIEEITELAGCDRLTIPPHLLKELSETEGDVTCKLFYNMAQRERPICMTESEFLWQHNQNLMAVEKLLEGIRFFNIDQIQLKKIIFNLI
ncbi:transaldolase [Candidatus Erwinia haradaeae]|uniref:Transaldolase n=1 Tax=Candidatus Erwinia haradaeae TaxID=1922217 RepID=A0A451D2Y8_9GAMM|nr:transaldolase [Candidatus Erwinia haradaeae]VFP80014.1 Transaldolase B [Candidatus Erwinia haradaeae]